MNTCYFIQKRGIVRAIALFILLVASVTGCGGQQMAGVGTGGTGGNLVAMGGSIQGKALALKNVVTTYAGSSGTVAGSSGSMDGVGTSASFSNPEGITTDGVYLYVTDSHNNTIRKIVIATGEVTTLAGLAGPNGSSDGIGSAASFCNPKGITTDGTNLYVVDSGNFTIRKIVIATGEVTTFAGSANNFGPADGIGTSAQFYAPTGIASDGLNLYVTDFAAIRKIEISTRVVTTIAGSAYNLGSEDGIGSAARFCDLHGITTDGINLYVSDSNNNTIRKIVISSGVVSTIAGNAGVAGSVDGTGSAATFSYPTGITIDDNNIFVTDYFNSNIRKIDIKTGDVTTLAGKAGNPGSSDGTGDAARFKYHEGITAVGSNLFVADSGNNTIRKIELPNGVVTTLAGTTLGSSGAIDGFGNNARFNRPLRITTDGSNLYVTDYGNDIIRKIVIATGEVLTIAGTAGNWGAADGVGPAASFSHPTGITTDGSNLFIVDAGNKTIRKIALSTRSVTTIAGSVSMQGTVDGIGAAARFNFPSDITTDGQNLYVTDENTIRKIEISNGRVTTLAGTPGVTGSIDGIGAAASFNQPRGITTDGVNLFVSEYGNSMIRKIVISTGVVSTLAGSEIPGSADGIGATAAFFDPESLTTDGTNLYVTDTGNNTIRKIEVSTGTVTTIAGTDMSRWGSVDGIGSTARFYAPTGITTDGRNLYVVELGNNLIRKIH